LGDYLDPELISRCLAEAGTVTLRKRRLPLEMMVWCIVGMALERKEALHQIVNRLDIMLPGNRPFVAPSAWAARLFAACSRKQHSFGIVQRHIRTGAV
jgi:putative transposase